MTTTRLWKTTTLYVHHTFWYISWQSCANKQRENSSWEGVVTETWADVSRDNSQRRFLAQYIVTTLFWYCFEWLQHCFNIATMCCAKNRCCESSRLTSSLWCGKRGKKKNKQTKNYNVAAKPVEKQCSHCKFYHPRSNLFCNKSGCGFWCVNTDFCLDKIALELRHLGSYVTFGSVKRATFTNMYRTTLFTLL